MALPLLARHIQDHTEANTTEQHHWAYPSRILPCTKDAGTCEYLDAVYWMHDISMRYTFILWGVLLGVALVWVALRGWRMGGPGQRLGSLLDRLCDGAEYARRRWLLPDAPAKWLFGRTSRLQVVILAVMLAYLLVFSLVGIVYKTWITPIKASPLHNTRTGLGGFSDRVGALAYALTPLTIVLANRESVLSWLTGVPYQHFNFLHRWLGRVIFVQAFLHTLGWTIIEGKLYQPQPSVYAGLMAEQYIIFGVVAMCLLTLMLLLSTQTAIRWFGYEAFRISHWIIAALYIGACWGHWDKLWCWMVPSLVLMVGDQAVRAARTLYLHYRVKQGASTGFTCAPAGITLLGTADDLVVRLDFEYEHRQPWQAGQHFYICFPSLSIWQSHPFTPASLPDPNALLQRHTYLIRARKGQTAVIGAGGDGATLPAILTGPYGRPFPSYGAQNILTVAGGTGVTFTLPIVLAAMHQQTRPKFAVDFVWVVRKTQDLMWLKDELALLAAAVKENSNLRVRIFVTRESPAIHEVSTDKESGSSADIGPQDLLEGLVGLEINFLSDHRPSMAEVMVDFLERTKTVGGAVEVVGSGPEAMSSDLRSTISAVKDKESLSFYWDSRD